MLTDQLHPPRDVTGRLGGHETVDELRGVLVDTGTHDPLEGGTQLRHHCGGVGQPQQIAVAPALTLPVFDRLVGQGVGAPIEVPGPDSSPEPASPATELPDVPREGEQVRSRAGDARQGCQGQRRRFRHGGRVGQGEQGRPLFGCDASLGDLDDGLDQARRVAGGHSGEDLRVVERELTRSDVVGATVDPQGQEATQTRPVIEPEGVPARRVGDLTRVGRFTLRCDSGADGTKGVHDLASFLVVVVTVNSWDRAGVR